MRSLLFALMLLVCHAQIVWAEDFDSGQVAVTAFLASDAGEKFRGTMSSASNLTEEAWRAFEGWIRTQGYAPVGWKGCGSGGDSRPWDGTDNVVKQNGTAKTGYDVCMLIARDGVTEKAIKNTRWRSAPTTADPNADVWNGWFYGRSFEIASGYRTKEDDALFRIYVKKELPRWQLPGDLAMDGREALCIACTAQGGTYAAPVVGPGVGTCTRSVPARPQGHTAATAPLTWPTWFDFGGPESAVEGDTESDRRMDWNRRYEAVVYASGRDVMRHMLVLPYKHATAKDLTSELPAIASGTALGAAYAACRLP